MLQFKSSRSRTVARVASRRVGVDQRLIKAIAHPLRHRVLLALGEGVSSPNRLAAQLGEPLGRVSHHVRVLKRLGAVELVDTQHRRGAVEHFYQATMQPFFGDDAWSRLPGPTRRAFFAQGVGQILEDVSHAAAAGGFDHPRAHVSYTLLELDQRGYAEVAGILDETLERVIAAREAAQQRVSGNGGTTLRTEVALLHFERG